MVDWSMAHGASNSDSRSAIFFMLLSAGIFGYFGFSTTWLYTGVNGQFLLFVALLDWTLKITAVAFGLAVVLTFILPWLGAERRCSAAGRWAKIAEDGGVRHDLRHES
jgi:hypothetical protein